MRIFVFAGVALGLAHLIEIFAQLAGLFIEALGFLREAALAAGISAEDYDRLVRPEQMLGPS